MHLPRQLLYSMFAGSLAIASIVLPARAHTQTPETAPGPTRIKQIVPSPQQPGAEMSCIEQIKDRFPDTTDGNYVLGWCYLSFGKFDDAVAAFQNSIRLIPVWIKEREGIDTSHLPKLTKEQEKEFYYSAGRLLLARFSLGWTYQQAGRYDEAVAAYEQIPSAYPASEEAMYRTESEEARYQTAMIHLVYGNREAAVKQVAKMGERFERRLDIESKLLIPDLTPSDESVSNGAPIIPTTFPIRPTILYREKAKYTEEARQAKMHGTVVLQAIFRSDGVMVITQVIKSLPFGLTLKAVEAAGRIRFTPAMKDGAPVSVRGQLEFTFNLY